MNIWKANQENVITVIGTENSLLSAYYVLDNSNNSFTQIPGAFSYQDGRYYLRYTFNLPGTYIIKVTDAEGQIKDLYSKLIVADEDYTSLVTLYKSDSTIIKNNLSSLTTLVSELPTYEDIDGLAGLTSEEHSKLMGITLSPSDIWSYSNRTLSTPSGMTSAQENALIEVLAKVSAIDLLKFTQLEKNQLLTLINYNDGSVQTQLDYISNNLGLTASEHNQLFNLTNISPSDVWGYSSRVLTSGIGLSSEQEETLNSIKTSVDTTLINKLNVILSEIGLKVEPNDLTSIENLVTQIKSKTDTLTNYSDVTIKAVVDSVNDKVTILDSKVEDIGTLVTSKETFTSTDRSKLNSLGNFDDSEITSSLSDIESSLQVLSDVVAKESTIQQVKSKVDTLNNFDDTTIINMLNNLPLLPAIKQELVNVNYGRLVIDPNNNTMKIYDKSTDNILASYYLYDNNGALNSSRVFRREPV